MSNHHEKALIAAAEMLYDEESEHPDRDSIKEKAAELIDGNLDRTELAELQRTAGKASTYMFDAANKLDPDVSEEPSTQFLKNLRNRASGLDMDADQVQMLPTEELVNRVADLMEAEMAANKLMGIAEDLRETISQKEGYIDDCEEYIDSLTARIKRLESQLDGLPFSPESK